MRDDQHKSEVTATVDDFLDALLNMLKPVYLPQHTTDRTARCTGMASQ